MEKANSFKSEKIYAFNHVVAVSPCYTEVVRGDHDLILETKCQRKLVVCPTIERLTLLECHTTESPWIRLYIRPDLIHSDSGGSCFVQGPRVAATFSFALNEFSITPP